jgi:hypothetical protein
MKSEKERRLVIPVDLKSNSLAADLLDCIAGLPLFVDAMRKEAEREDVSRRVVDGLVQMFRQADETDENLSLLGAAAPDLLYIQAMELKSFDDWTLRYTRLGPRLLFDQLRVRGICSFYILDNTIREDRFKALVEIFTEAGLWVHSPGIDGASLADIISRIDACQTLHNHIVYVEPDATVNYLEAIRTLPKHPYYTGAFRNQAPDSKMIEILQLSKSHSMEVPPVSPKSSGPFT